MKDQKLLLLSHSLIGTGFFFLYIQHVRTIYETRTNIAYLPQLERESMLQQNALYYSFYKTITEEPDFWAGYAKLKNLSGIEYPNTVNVVQKFHVLPELVIGYLYHMVRRYNSWAVIPFFSCWRANDIEVPVGHQACDLSGQAMQFYLEFVWVMGGLTVLIIYMYGTLLSENVSGGIYAVISYVMFHSYASKIYDNPMARENFAFPLLLMQMFYMCLTIDRILVRRHYRSRPTVIFMLTSLTTLSLLCWQFSAVIYATQILIMMMPWVLTRVSNDVVNSFTIDYALSQLVSVAAAYYFSHGNRMYFFSWQVGPAISLVFISMVRKVKRHLDSERSLKAISMSVLIAVSLQGTITDMLEKTGLVPAVENNFAHYHGLVLRWLFQQKVMFGTCLDSCNPAYSRFDLTELWDLVKTLVVRPYCMYGVVMLARFFRKWRKSGELSTPSSEHIERAKNYVLEDFLEENHVSMRDMSNKETEDDLNECLKLLEECDYDYERYKAEKAAKKSCGNQRKEFLDDISKLMEEIHVNRQRQSKQEEEQDQQQTVDGMQCEAAKEACKAAKEEDPASDGDREEAAKDPNATKPGDLPSSPSKASATTNPSAPPPTTTSNNNTNTSNTQAPPPRRPSKMPTHGAGDAAAAADLSAADAGDFFNFHYLYSFIQMVIFTVLGLSVRKLFFMCFTQVCVIAPTISSKFWYHKERSLFWTISITVFAVSMVHPGMVNVHEEYFPQKVRHTEDLDSMLEWINMNTEKDAVFAGPLDVIGTVHLTTRRPIVNHGHIEMMHMNERSEHIYAVFSRQQSSDIYTQYSQMKIQYLIISMKDCQNEINDDCDILSIWDDVQPAYRKFPQFCYELNHKNIPSFLKVFANERYGIIKMFSQSVQINLKYNKMPEKVM